MISTLYPLGCGLELETDSEDVVRTAESLWAQWPRLFDGAAVRLRVDVSEEGERAVCDLERGTASVVVSGEVAGQPETLTYRVLEPLVYSMLGTHRFVMLHAAAVELNGAAVLLCGDSGSGKSSLAYACGRRGWGFMSGDASQLVQGTEPLRVVGRPHEIRFRGTARELFPELVRWPVRRGPAGKLDIAVSTAELGLRGVCEAEIAAIVMLDRGEREGGLVADVTPEAALAYFEKSLLIGNERLKDRHRAELRRLAELPKFRLQYSDLDAAERELRGLVASRVGAVCADC